MAKDKVAFSNGAQSVANKASRIGDQGGATQTVGKAQIRAGEEYAGTNKGNLALQSQNGASATGNSLTAAGNLHTANSDNLTRHVKKTVQHEETATETQATSSRATQGAADDLSSKVNRIRG